MIYSATPRRPFIRRTNILNAAAVFATVAGALCAQQPESGTKARSQPENVVRDVLDKFHAIRPQEKDLAVYGLDWAPTLKEAKARAAAEHRPVFLIVVTNSFGNIYTGHC